MAPSLGLPMNPNVNANSMNSVAMPFPPASSSSGENSFSSDAFIQSVENELIKQWCNPYDLDI
jgi:hypothetical protein